MENQFTRTEMLLGKEAIVKLAKSRVAIFGIGGVGSFVAEALARCGVGTLDLFDNDVVSISNINRQIIATHKTIGRPKVEVMKERITDINPDAIVHTWQVFYLPEVAVDYKLSNYDYVIDAIDTVTAKLTLIQEAYKYQVPIISSMGTGNKLDPTKLEVSDIYDTSVCPLAKVMRKELKKREIPKLKVVYSKELARKPYSCEENLERQEQREANEGKRVKEIPGSVAFVPSVAGMILASEVVKDLTSSL